jgi:hypothetical protein
VTIAKQEEVRLCSRHSLKDTIGLEERVAEASGEEVALRRRGKLLEAGGGLLPWWFCKLISSPA